jgi:hypothetical protein
MPAARAVKGAEKGNIHLYPSCKEVKMNVPFSATAGVDAPELLATLLWAEIEPNHPAGLVHSH